MASTTRSPGGKWLKGQSGNPGGRPAVAREVREAAQRHAPDAIAELYRLMTESADDRVRKAAADSILDRAVGKPEAASAANVAGHALLEALAQMRANAAAHAEQLQVLQSRRLTQLNRE